MEEGDSLLQDIESEISLPIASVGQRFLNFIIDSIAYYVISYVVGVFFTIIILAANNGERIFVGSSDSDSGVSLATIQLLLLLLNLIFLMLYYVLFEKLTKGRTIGKFITGTKVEDLNGSDISWSQAFLRSIIRFIPLEPFSCLGGYPWHDKWSYTKTVKVR